MAIKKFAVPLDSASIQTGDTNFEALVDNALPVTFELSNVISGSTNTLNLITCKGSSPKDHNFNVTVFGSAASVILSASQMQAVFNDADGGDWDYVEALWTVGGVDTPSASNQHEVQSGTPYNLNGWPPKTK